jgi:glycosyltransferase involved in cell wall biosynthesis
MKILQIANKFPYPPKDGGSIATLSVARSLASLGHQVTILAMNTSKHFVDPETVPLPLREQIRFIGIPVDTRIRPCRLAWNFFLSPLPYNAERFISTSFRKRLEALLGEERFDVVQLEGLYTAPYLGSIRKLSSALVAMRAHNIEHEIWERSAARESGPRRCYLNHLKRRIRRMELNYLNQYDVMLPITARDGEILSGLGCTIPMHVLPTGVDGDKMPYDPSGIDFSSVFHIGALDWMPNQEGLSWFLEEVWPLVMRRLPSLKLYIAGRNASENYARKLRHEGVVFLGEVEDAWGFMASRAIMVVPLRSGSGMRIKIIEGMALGKAIVSTSIGTEGIPTTQGENIFKADDPGDFAEMICRLVENKDLMLKIGENARKFALEKFDNRAIASKLATFFDEQAKHDH